MNGFTTLVSYREIEKDKEVIPVDNEDVVIGLQALAVKPVSAQTDGRKLIVNFLKDEAAEPFGKIQASLAGVSQPLQVDYNLVLLGKLNWKGLLTMMRSVPFTAQLRTS